MGEATMIGAGLDRYPVVEAAIECSGHAHLLRCEAGALTALDHRDIDGERALAALGGQRCACVDAVDSWARHTDDLRVLILASRGPSDEIRSSDQAGGRRLTPFVAAGAPIGRMISVMNTAGTAIAAGTTGPQAAARAAKARAQARATARGGSRNGGWFAYAPSTAMAGPFPDGEEDDLVSLLALDGRLAERLAAIVAATWAERAESGDPRADSASVRAALVAALYGRATCTLRRWLAEPQAQIDIEMLAARSAPATIGRSAGVVQLAVPFDWIVDVWGRGIAVILDRLVLCVLADATDELTVLTVGHSLDDPRPMTLTLG